MTEPVNPMTRMYATQHIVSAVRRRASAVVDELAWAEKKVLTDLVIKVHTDGFAGLWWPNIKRIPMRWDSIMGELREPMEWHIRVSVRAVPRAAVTR